MPNSKLFSFLILSTSFYFMKATAQDSNDVEKMFNKWTKKYNKKYSSEKERTSRQKIWIENHGEQIVA